MSHIRIITLRLAKTYTNEVIGDNYSHEKLADACRAAIELVNACRTTIDAEDANAGRVGTWAVEAKTFRRT